MSIATMAGLLGFAASLSSAVCGQSVPVANASFESPSLGLCGFNTDANSWTESGNGGVWRTGSFGQCLNSYNSGPPDGQQIGYVNSGSLAQTLTTSLSANTLYTLRVRVGRRYDCCQSLGTDYTVQLRSGGVLLAQDAGSLVITNGTFRMTTIRFGTGATHPSLGQPLQIVLLQGTNGQANFDDVEMTAVTADCNGNGVFDAIDIANGASDSNSNGVPDTCESNSCTADIHPPVTGDNAVNVGDLLAVIASWGNCAGCPSDFVPAHGNGQINVSDLLGVIGAWGTCPIIP